MNEYRFGDLEFRQDDNGLGVVTGTVIRYGDVATLPWGTEEFKAGAFNGRMEDIIANRMHQRTQPLARLGGGLTVTDTTTEMRTEVTLPDTTFGRDVAVELTARILRGISLEFRIVKDDVTDTGHRIVTEARMFGFGIVDKPAYPESVASMKRWADYRSEYGLWPPKPKTTRHFLPVV